jgi:hypothetical protein
MMGMHARLGADSPVLLLDRDIAVSISRNIIADKWYVCVYVCMYVVRVCLCVLHSQMCIIYTHIHCYGTACVA